MGLLHTRSRSQRSSCSECVQRISSEPQNILLPILIWLCSIINQSVMQKNWFTVFNVKATAKGQMILLNQQTFRCQTWYCDASSWAGVSCIWSRSHQGFTWSKYDSFYYIFWTVDPFVTKFAFIVHYHKPVCLLKKLDCCIQDLRSVYPWQWEQKTKHFQFKLHTFFVDNLFWLCSSNVHNGPLFWCSHGFSLFPGCAEWSAYTTKGQ